MKRASRASRDRARSGEGSHSMMGPFSGERLLKLSRAEISVRETRTGCRWYATIRFRLARRSASVKGAVVTNLLDLDALRLVLESMPAA